MPEPLLRLEEVSPANQIGGDGMSKSVETDARGCPGKRGSLRWRSPA